jgi:hypothetical protein
MTGGMVDPSDDRPPWLGVTVHAVNSLLSWAEVICSRPRTFSKRARYMSLGLSLCYLAFIVACRCASPCAASMQDALRAQLWPAVIVIS